MKITHLEKNILIIVTFLICSITPLIYVLLAIKTDDSNLLQKLIFVLLGSHIFTILNTCLLKWSAAFKDPKKYVEQKYTASLIAYLIVFSCFLINTRDMEYVLVNFLILFDLTSDYIERTSFNFSKFKKEIAEFFKNKENYFNIAINIVFTLFIALEIVIR